MLHLLQDQRIPTEVEVRALSVAMAFVQVGHASRWAIRAGSAEHGAPGAWLARVAGPTAMLLIEPVATTGAQHPIGQATDNLRIRLVVQRGKTPMVAERELFDVSGMMQGALEAKVVTFVSEAMRKAEAEA